MTIDNLIAVSEFVYVIKQEPETHRGGLLLPEPSQKAPNMGKIISVGNLVQDKNIKKGRVAIFNKQVGAEIEVFGTNVTVLNGNNQITAVTTE